MRPEFTVRIGTQDPQTFKEVLYDNCYKLPDRFEPGARVVDVGANIGAFSVACLARGAGVVTAVEPHPDNFDLLRRNTAKWVGQMQYARAALYWRHKEWCPIQDRGPHTAMHCVGGGEQGIAVTAPRVTLDELIPIPPSPAAANQQRPVRLLKLDCEGGEYPGLFECTRLAAVEQIIVECHTVTLTDAPAEFNEKRVGHLAIITNLQANGFEVTAVEPDKAGINYVVWARNKKG